MAGVSIASHLVPILRMRSPLTGFDKARYFICSDIRARPSYRKSLVSGTCKLLLAKPMFLPLILSSHLI